MGLEHHCFERARGGWHCAVVVIGYGRYPVGNLTVGVIVAAASAVDLSAFDGRLVIRDQDGIALR